MRIFLVRHGQSESNLDISIHRTVADHAVSLTPRGKQQATEAGQFLADYLVKSQGVKSPRVRYPPRLRVWSSPYRRARQTTSQIMAVLEDTASHVFLTNVGPREFGFEFDQKENVALCEQSFGLFDGLSEEEKQQQYPQEHAHCKKYEGHRGNFWIRRPLGESEFDVAIRVQTMFADLRRDAGPMGINTVILVCHGVAMQAFAMQWFRYPYEWMHENPIPNNCSIRMIEDDVDHGFIFNGFVS